MSKEPKYEIGIPNIWEVEDDVLLPAARIHDIDYIQQVKPRKQVDDEFYQRMKRMIRNAKKQGILNEAEAEAKEARAKRFHSIVRFGGWVPWYVRKLRKRFAGGRKAT